MFTRRAANTRELKTSQFIRKITNQDYSMSAGNNNKNTPAINTPTINTALIIFMVTVAAASLKMAYTTENRVSHFEEFMLEQKNENLRIWARFNRNESLIAGIATDSKTNLVVLNRVERTLDKILVLSTNRGN